MVISARGTGVDARQSIWLLPKQSDSDCLQRLVDRLALDIGSKPFPPHLTLLPEVTAAPDRIRAVLASLGSSGRISAGVAGAHGCDDPRRAVHLTLVTSEFIRLRSRVAAGLGRTDGLISEPHVSLAYGSHAVSHREDLVERVRREHLPSTIEFDRIALVEHDDDSEGLNVMAVHAISAATTSQAPHLETLIAAFQGFRSLAVPIGDAVEFGPNRMHEYFIDAREKSWRDFPPLEQSFGCVFCTWYGVPASHDAPIPNTASRARLADHALCGGRLLIYNCNPNPLPDRDALQAAFQLLDVCRRSNIDVLAACNLPGSGASVPDHFHWQIVHWTPLVAMLFGNYASAATETLHLGGVDLRECSGPVPSVEFSFPVDWGTSDRVDWTLRQVFASVLHKQQGLSANLYLFSQGRRGLLVWRNASCECPYSESPAWRWAWMEMLGALCVRAGASDDKLCLGRWLEFAKRTGLSAKRAKGLLDEWYKAGAPAVHKANGGGKCRQK